MAVKERRIGVYVCHCGTNIEATVKTSDVAEYALTLRGVVVARDYIFMCSDPGQETIRNDIKNFKLNRVVVASCSPHLHEKTFRRVCRESGINPYLFEMANIREHCSWVHHEGATNKAKELVKSSVMRVYYNEPLEMMEVPIKPTAMVVGGGIAGIQSALDIANAGYKVYLVEREPSIGGHMIQLDKTFPTLDCSACIMTPKMSDAGSHKNIELLNYSEVESVSGFIGNFKVKIRQKAKFVNDKKCTGCGVCFEKCPVVMKNEYDLNMADRKAIYRPFPQAVPNKAVIDKRENRLCKAACMDACPIHTNVPGYVKLISEGRPQDAYKLIRSTNPLPAVCGLVCYAPCESNCNLGQFSDAMAIRQLKRFAVEQSNIDDLPVPGVKNTGKKVAIIGAGPAGLAAANDLVVLGHDVTIYESSPEPGGMLRYGIPEYRLPKAILKKEIDYIKKLGVKIQTGVKIGKDIPVSELKEKYQAIFIAAGAQGGVKLGVDGESIPGVFEGLSFLHDINSGKTINIGKTVTVIGGGNTAIDCARTAKRLGASEVRIIYRRSREEMPAAKDEIASAEAEGVQLNFLATPVEFIAEKGILSKIKCIKMELGEPDASGRRQPVPVKGSEFEITTATAITALGQSPVLEFVTQIGVSLSKRGTIEADLNNCSTSVSGVFAGGDAVTGAAFVVDAISYGQIAARSINSFLKGEKLQDNEEKQPEKLTSLEIDALKKRYTTSNRISVKEQSVNTRVNNFEDSNIGYTPDEALKEASRCLAGQIEGCIECHECERVCDAKAIDYTLKDEVKEVEVGSIVLATGYDAFDPSVIKQYGYKKYDNVITGLEFERLSNATGPTGGQIKLKNGKTPESVAIVNCVGSRDKNYHEYCSRVCCMYGLKFAHLIKEKAKAEVYQIYIDMRCFGEGYEAFYERVGTQDGAKFVRGKVSKITDQALSDEEKGKLIVSVEDTLLGKVIRIPVEMVVLCNALQPRADAEKVAKMFSIGRRADGFFMEKHVKLEPINTVSDGVFIAGCCESPRDIPDTVAQAKAAASEVLSLFIRGKVEIEPLVARVDDSVCSGCGLCEQMCSFGALSLSEKEKLMTVNEALCKGCGSCAATCYSGAITLAHFTPRQIIEQVEALSTSK